MSQSRRPSQDFDQDLPFDDFDQTPSLSWEALAAFFAPSGPPSPISFPAPASPVLQTGAPMPWMSPDDLFGPDPTSYDPALLDDLFGAPPDQQVDDPMGAQEDLFANGPITGRKRTDRSDFDQHDDRKRQRQNPTEPAPRPTFTPEQLLPGRDLIPLNRPSRLGQSPPQSKIMSPVLKLQPPRSYPSVASASGQALPWSQAPTNSFTGKTPGQPGSQTVKLPAWPTKGADEEIQKNSKTKWEGTHQAGHYPAGINTNYELPKKASYAGQYSAQLLSQLSYVSRGALDQGQLNPVEVQYGYGLKQSGAMELFASTNNLVTQTALAEKLADPKGMVEQVATSNRGSYAGNRNGFTPSISHKDAKTRSDYAERLLGFDKLEERRRAEIVAALKTGEINADQAAARHRDLDLTRQIFNHFAGGQVTVVKNPPPDGKRKKTPDGATALTDARARVSKNESTWNQAMASFLAAKDDPKVTQKPARPSKKSLGNDLQDPQMWPERHAEQNISEALHARNADSNNTDPFVAADIHGTMCRCAACASELGQNTLDPDGKPVSGRIWVAQGNKDGLSKISHDSFTGANHMLPKTVAADPPQPDSPMPFYEPPAASGSGT